MLYLDYSRKAGRVDPQRARRPREPGGDPPAARAERGGLRQLSRRADHRRGVDRLADGVAADLRRRPRLRLQVGHGVDARHPRLSRERSRSTASTTTTRSPSGRSTPSTRTSCCRSRTTRWCTARARWSTRCRATPGRSSPTSGCSTATCTPSRARSSSSWARSSRRSASGTTTRASTGSLLDDPGARRDRPLGRGPQPPLPRRARPARARLRPRRLRVDRRLERRAERHRLPAARQGRRPRRSRSSSTSRRCRATTIASASPAAATGGSCSTATPPNTAAAARGNCGGVEAAPIPLHGKTHSLTLTLPPLGVLFLKREAAGRGSRRGAGRGGDRGRRTRSLVEIRTSLPSSRQASCRDPEPSRRRGDELWRSWLAGIELGADPGSDPSSIHREDHRCRFRVWAPRARRVEARLCGAPPRPPGAARARLFRGEPWKASSRERATLQPRRWARAARSRLPFPAGRGARAVEVVDRRFAWSDAGWRGIPLGSYIFYELHVGTFTPEGTFEAVIPHLDRLRRAWGSPRSS